MLRLICTCNITACKCNNACLMQLTLRVGLKWSVTPCTTQPVHVPIPCAYLEHWVCHVPVVIVRSKICFGIVRYQIPDAKFLLALGSPAPASVYACTNMLSHLIGVTSVMVGSDFLIAFTFLCFSGCLCTNNMHKYHNVKLYELQAYSLAKIIRIHFYRIVFTGWWATGFTLW